MPPWNGNTEFGEYIKSSSPLGIPANRRSAVSLNCVKGSKNTEFHRSLRSADLGKNNGINAAITITKNAKIRPSRAAIHRASRGTANPERRH